ncbi:DUF1559 family PulG-like putative transporter [Gemmata sp.]|uniref:DUF1559 family PulG-like putative transporter n=1 Tax=Gemmata sp. TaxID=1914242 RepID=UPI003F7206E8
MRLWARTACALAAVVASLVVAACGRQSESSPPEATPKSDAAQPAKKDAGATLGDREANRQTSLGNLKDLVYAAHSYHDVMGSFPRQAWVEGMAGMKLVPGGLSWRVHLLKQLKHEELYNQFKLGEPWDSEHNKKLIEKMPKVYVSPGVPTEPGQTYFKLLVGPGTAYDPTKPAPSVIMNDGSSNTIMIVEGGGPVTWTKPDDITIDLSKPLPDLSLAGDRTVNVAMFDANQRVLDLDKLSEATLKAAITPAGKDVLGPDWNSGARLIPKKKEPVAPSPPRRSSSR